jgi:hypothetical protein
MDQEDHFVMSKHPEGPQRLTLNIRSLTKSLQVGDPVPIEFTIKNIDNTFYDYQNRNYDRAGRMPEYELTAQFGPGTKVDDPRKDYPITSMGGLSSQATLKQEESAKKTIDLNRWAVLTQPGKYTVTGIYQLENGKGAVRSKPIQIVLKPRTKSEMETYVNQLRGGLAQPDGEKLDDVVQKLMFTQDPSVIPWLIDAMYNHKNNFWLCEALNFYMPRESVRSAILKASKERGLAPSSTSILYFLKRPWTPGSDPLPPEDWKEMIKRSLAADNPICWSEGSLAAQQHPNDTFSERLIAIAESPKAEGRHQAIFALAFNRTDTSVKALKKLLNDPDASVRDTTKLAIKVAYGSRGNAPGRRMLDTDFEPSLRTSN